MSGSGICRQPHPEVGLDHEPSGGRYTPWGEYKNRRGVFSHQSWHGEPRDTPREIRPVVFIWHLLSHMSNGGAAGASQGKS